MIYLILTLIQRKATTVSTPSKNNNNIKYNTVVYEGGNVKSVTVEYDNNNNNISYKTASANRVVKSKLEKALEIDDMLLGFQFVIALTMIVAAFITFENTSQFWLTSVVYISLVAFSSIIRVLLSKNTNRKVNKNIKRSTFFIVLLLGYIFCIIFYQVYFYQIYFTPLRLADIIILTATSLYGIVVAINVSRNKGKDFIPEKQPITPIPRKNILIVGILLAIGTIALIGEGVYLKMSKNTEISSASADNTNSTSDIYITVTAEKAIKLRKTPSLDFEEINIIPTGTRLKVIEKTTQKDTFEGIESNFSLSG